MKLEYSQAKEMLQMHIDAVHPQQPAPINNDQGRNRKSKAEKVARPKIQLGVSEDEYGFFECLWASYKRSCELSEVEDIRDQLLACCETELRRDIHRSLGSAVQTKSEQEIMLEIKKLAVLVRSNLVNVVALMSASQERDENIRSYLARVRGMANVCKLSETCSSGTCQEQVSYANTFIKYALVKGLFDDEVKEELLSQTPELNLDQSLSFVEAKEQGKRSSKALGEAGLASEMLGLLYIY